MHAYCTYGENFHAQDWSHGYDAGTFSNNTYKTEALQHSARINHFEFDRPTIACNDIPGASPRNMVSVKARNSNDNSAVDVFNVRDINNKPPYLGITKRVPAHDANYTKPVHPSDYPLFVNPISKKKVVRVPSDMYSLRTDDISSVKANLLKPLEEQAFAKALSSNPASKSVPPAWRIGATSTSANRTTGRINQSLADVPSELAADKAAQSAANNDGKHPSSSTNSSSNSVAGSYKLSQLPFEWPKNETVDHRHANGIGGAKKLEVLPPGLLTGIASYSGPVRDMPIRYPDIFPAHLYTGKDGEQAIASGSARLSTENLTQNHSKDNDEPYFVLWEPESQPSPPFNNLKSEFPQSSAAWLYNMNVKKAVQEMEDRKELEKLIKGDISSRRRADLNGEGEGYENGVDGLQEDDNQYLNRPVIPDVKLSRYSVQIPPFFNDEYLNTLDSNTFRALTTDRYNAARKLSELALNNNTAYAHQIPQDLSQFNSTLNTQSSTSSSVNASRTQRIHKSKRMPQSSRESSSKQNVNNNNYSNITMNESLPMMAYHGATKEEMMQRYTRTWQGILMKKKGFASHTQRLKKGEGAGAMADAFRKVIAATASNTERFDREFDASNEKNYTQRHGCDDAEKFNNHNHNSMHSQQHSQQFGSTLASICSELNPADDLHEFQRTHGMFSF
jgi:hypothetical protein